MISIGPRAPALSPMLRVFPVQALCGLARLEREGSALNLVPFFCRVLMRSLVPASYLEEV